MRKPKRREKKIKREKKKLPVPDQTLSIYTSHPGMEEIP